jgi:cephalosporin hydroxylase
MLLTEILEQNDLDTDKNTTHCHIDEFYEAAFAPYKDKTIALLEIGISYGASLVLWRKYFENAKFIAGIDNRPEIIPDHYKIDGVSHFYGDAYDPEIKKQLPKLNIIIDDGSHHLQDQLTALEIYYPLLIKGGIYVVEDIQQQLYPDAREQFIAKVEALTHKSYEWLDLRHVKDRPDDTLLVIRK